MQVMRSDCSILFYSGEALNGVHGFGYRTSKKTWANWKESREGQQTILEYMTSEESLEGQGLLSFEKKKKTCWRFNNTLQIQKKAKRFIIKVMEINCSLCPLERRQEVMVLNCNKRNLG